MAAEKQSVDEERPGRLRIASSALLDFFFSWLETRPRFAILGLPSLILGVLVVVCGVYLLRAPGAIYVPAAVKEYQSAVRQDDLQRQDIALNALIRLEPSDNIHRFRLGVVRARQNRIANAESIMRSLTREGGGDGYVPAYLWLVALSAQKVQTATSAEERIELLKTALEIEPDNPRAALQLSEIYFARGEPDRAEDVLSAAAESDPICRVRLARSQEMTGRMEQARETAAQAVDQLKAIVASYPDAPAARLQLAEAFRLAGNPGDAARVLAEGLKEKDEPAIRQALSKLMLQQYVAQRVSGRGSPQIAISCARDAFHLTPTDPEVLEALIQCLSIADIPLEQAQLEAAISGLRTRLEDTPSDARSTEALAWLLAASGDADQARDMMDRACVLEPDFRLRQVQLLQKLNLTGEATANLELLAEELTAKLNADESERTATQLAQILVQLNRWKQLGEVVDRLPEPAQLPFRFRQFDGLVEANDESYLDLAKSLWDQWRTQPGVVVRIGLLAARNDAGGSWAREVLRKEIDEGDEARRSVYQGLLGAAACRIEDYDLAISQLQQAHEGNPNDPVVCNNLAFALIQAPDGDLRAASELIRRAIDLLPNHPEVLVTRGQFFSKRQDFRSAIRDFKSALIVLQKQVRPPGREESRLHRLIAEGYLALGNDALAEEHTQLAEAATARDGS